MLALLQIMNYMLADLDYSEQEVKDLFRKVADDELSLEVLLDIIGLEISDLSLELAKEKLPKWKSALAVTKMRLGL
jgi:Mn-containing catalase